MADQGSGKARNLASGIAVVLMAMVATATGIWLQRSGEAPAVQSALANLSLPDPGGKAQSLAQWRGQVVLVNFWATWCEPCRKEMPALEAAQKQFGPNGLQIVGIAIDSPGKVAQFAKEVGVSYPLVTGGLETIEMIRELGNKAGGLPFTVVLDRQGRVKATHLGELSGADIERLIRPHLG